MSSVKARIVGTMVAVVLSFTLCNSISVWADPEDENSDSPRPEKDDQGNILPGISGYVEPADENDHSPLAEATKIKYDPNGKMISGFSAGEVFYCTGSMRVDGNSVYYTGSLYVDQSRSGDPELEVIRADNSYVLDPLNGSSTRIRIPSGDHTILISGKNHSSTLFFVFEQTAEQLEQSEEVETETLGVPTSAPKISLTKDQQKKLEACSENFDNIFVGVKSNDPTDDHYYGANGEMIFDELLFDGDKLYYLNSSGQIRKRVIVTLENGSRIFCGKTGEVYTTPGKKTYQHKDYLINSNGVIASEEFVTNEAGKMYYAGSDGLIKTGLFKVKGVSYVTNSTGAIQKHTVTKIDGYEYYSDSDGSIVKNTIIMWNGVRYQANKDGKLKKLN